MPPRIRKIQHDEDTRARIGVARIINRLEGHIHGEIELTATQISAAKILLDKALPNLQSVDVKQENTTTFVLRAPSPAKDATEWLTNFAPKTIDGTLNPSPSGSPSPALRRPS